MLRELAHGCDVGLLRPCREASELHIVDHPLTERAHGISFRAMNQQMPGNDVPVLTAKQAEGTITANLPPIDHHGEIVETVGPNSLRIRLPFKQEFMGAEPWQNGGGLVFSGPMVMGLADPAM